MGNVLLDVMQGTLVCLDSYHMIVDVSKTVKHYFGFEQVCSREKKMREKKTDVFSSRPN
jgi:hypothetical protein